MKRRGVLIHVAILLVIAIIGLGPWVLTFGAGAIATANGCTLDEGSVHPCLIAGSDYGETLYTFGLMGWVGLMTCPLALILLFAYLVIVLIRWLMNRPKAPASS